MQPDHQKESKEQSQEKVMMLFFDLHSKVAATSGPATWRPVANWRFLFSLARIVSTALHQLFLKPTPTCKEGEKNYQRFPVAKFWPRQWLATANRQKQQYVSRGIWTAVCCADKSLPTYAQSFGQKRVLQMWHRWRKHVKHFFKSNKCSVVHPVGALQLVASGQSLPISQKYSTTTKVYQLGRTGVALTNKKTNDLLLNFVKRKDPTEIFYLYRNRNHKEKFSDIMSQTSPFDHPPSFTPCSVWLHHYLLLSGNRIVFIDENRWPQDHRNFVRAQWNVTARSFQQKGYWQGKKKFLGVIQAADFFSKRLTWHLDLQKKT